jgi:hypothetical protein
MTPKEKAKELVINFYNKITDGGDTETVIEYYQKALECALIAVAEIKKTTTDFSFWNEVENELKTL